MAKEKSKEASLLIFTLLTGLLSQSLVIPVITAVSLEDQKNYYSSGDPHAGGNPPKGGRHHKSPSHSHESPSLCNCGTPPRKRHHDPAPPTGGSPHTHTPPSTPSYGSPPTYDSPPTYGSPPPSPPYIDPGTPSTPTYGSPPTSPSIDPGTPSAPTYGSPPTTVSPPTTPVDPVTPTIPGISSPPVSIDPNSSPFPCTYWLTHPTLIWGLFGFYGTTLGGAFGLASSGSPPLAGTQVSLEQALGNTRSDGIGALYREGTAALLNSMAIKKFPFTTEQVRDRFVSALDSNKAASAQARVFKMANEGRLKPRT